MNSPKLTAALLLVIVLPFLISTGVMQAQPVGNDEFYSTDGNQNKGRPFRDIPPKYPECAGLVHEYWNMTDELYAKGEERQRAVDPESRQITQEINELAKDRNEVGKNILICNREASQTPTLGSEEPQSDSDSEQSGNPSSPGKENTLPPFELRTSQREYYGENVAADSGGEAPKESGVNWAGWYKKWIQLVNEEVNRKLGDHFRKQGDTYTYSAKLYYTVYQDPKREC